jgi:hypothetical protein
VSELQSNHLTRTDLFKHRNMTTPTYEIADFQELQSYIEYPIKEFVDLINYVVEDETQNELCDFYIVMNHLRNVNKPIFDYVFNFFVNTENNTFSLYIFLKFLLLDEEEQTQFVSKYFTQNQLLIDIHNRDIRDLPIQEIVKSIFELVEDDYLNNFLDYQDNYLQYRPLNIKNLKNINKANINYMDKQFIKRFVLNIRIIIRCKFVYKLIYFISDCLKTQVLEEGETSISPFEDYIRRFENNIDDFMFLFNYYHIVPQIYNKVDNVENLRKYYFKKIPNDRYLYYSNPVLDKAQIKVYIKKLFYKIITPNDDNMEYCLNSFIERNPKDLLRNLLLVEYKYDINVDNYRLAPVASLNKSISDILHKRYKGYFKSVLYRSLVLISDVHTNLAEIVKMSEDKNIMEFEQFLEKIFKTYHFERHFKY